MNVAIVMGDALFARMLSLEIISRGARVQPLDLSEEGADSKLDYIFTSPEYLSDALNARAHEIVIICKESELSSLGSTVYDHIVYTRPFVVSDMLDATIGKPSFHPEASKKKRTDADGLRLYSSTHSATYRGEQIPLTKKEFALLHLLHEKRGHTVKREEAAAKIFGADNDAPTNVVDVYVRYLREKIDERFKVKIITTVRGVGYTIKE